MIQDEDYKAGQVSSRDETALADGCDGSFRQIISTSGPIPTPGSRAFGSAAAPGPSLDRRRGNQHLWDQERRDRADAAVGTDDRRPADLRTLTRFFSDQNDFVTNMIGRTF
jgi:hypothetical protein